MHLQLKIYNVIIIKKITLNLSEFSIFKLKKYTQKLISCLRWCEYLATGTTDWLTHSCLIQFYRDFHLNKHKLSDNYTHSSLPWRLIPDIHYHPFITRHQQFIPACFHLIIFCLRNVCVLHLDSIEANLIP